MRKLIVDSVCLASYRELDPSSSSIINDIERVLDKIMEDILSSFSKDDPLPLVRINVDISGFPAIPTQVFGAKYVGRIANPSSLLLLKRKRISKNSMNEDEMDSYDISSGVAPFELLTSQIEKSLKEMGNMEFLNNRHLQEACTFCLYAYYC